VQARKVWHRKWSRPGWLLERFLLSPSLTFAHFLIDMPCKTERLRDAHSPGWLLERFPLSPSPCAHPRSTGSVGHKGSHTLIRRAILKGFASHIHVLTREVPFMAQASFSIGSRSHLLPEHKKNPPPRAGVGRLNDSLGSGRGFPGYRHLAPKGANQNPENCHRS